MNYIKHYDKLISRSKNRAHTGYLEKHHIIPVCMGGSNSPDNYAYLTPEEHYIAHLLLVKIYPKNYKLIHAAILMTTGPKDSILEKHRNNNKMYGWLRRRLSILKRKPYNTFTCHGCNSIFFSKTKTRKFCSSKCMGIYQSKTVSDNHKLVSFYCNVCKVEFYAKASANRVVCSRKCSNIFAKNKKKPVDCVYETRSCKFCGNNFNCRSKLKTVFCDNKCLNKHRDTLKNTKNCEYCNNIFTYAGWEVRRFCSRQCKISSQFILLN